ncbi:unnamed protein product [Closterium sp. Naga37s-1]|nr:unnamed protein product [Closterium sp. Naga37s-1]
MALPTSLYLALALLSLTMHAAHAANMPAGGCHTRYVCPYIDNLATATITASTYQNYKYIGDFQGLFNTQGGQFAPHQRGSGPVNFERYTEVGTIFAVVKGVSRLAGENARVAGFIDRIQCYLLEKNGGTGTSGSFKTPMAGDAATQAANTATYPLSFVGGLCNGTALVENDPHLTGAHGTHYDFTGRFDRSFCLFADRRFHVNMRLNGYQGAPPAVSTSNTDKESSTELHTWIKEIGVVWMTPDGANHTLRMVARKGKQQERGDNGFLSLLEIDGATTTPPSVGESITTNSGLVVTKIAEEKEGPFDVDQLQVRVVGLGELDVRVRVVHPLLQTPAEAETHFNVELSDVKMTSAVHGVLGQTFRNTPEQLQRAVKYSHLAALLHHPVDVDKAEGRGFLDGQVDDYTERKYCPYAFEIVQVEWEKIPAAWCSELIDSMPRRVRAVLKAKGRWTKY